jgi:ribosomal subunit interface protein
MGTTLEVKRTMSLRVSGKNIQIGLALQDYVRAHVDAMQGRTYGGTASGQVTLEPEGSGYRCETTLQLDSGTALHAEGRAQEIYACFDQANHRIETRLRRHRQRLRAQQHANGKAVATISTYTLEQPADDADEGAETEGFAPVIVAETKAPFKTLSVAAAVDELDLSGAPLLVFRHSVNAHINIVYRRADGHIGWIDPSTISEA